MSNSKPGKHRAPRNNEWLLRLSVFINIIAQTIRTIAVIIGQFGS